jgi:hypothetical protein
MANLNIKFNNKTFSIDPASLADALASLEGHLAAMVDEPGEPAMLAPGLYQPGAIALWQEGNYDAASVMMTTSWDELEANRVIAISEGVELPDDLVMNEYGFYFGVLYSATVDGMSVGFTFNEDGSAIMYQASEKMEIPAGTVIYGDHSIDMTAMDMFVFVVSADGTSIEADGLVFSVGSSSVPPKGTVYLPNLNIYDPVSIIEGDLVLPDDGRAISLPMGAFMNQASLTGICIPDSVTSIGVVAFSGCTSLVSINIPSNVTAIVGEMFSYCKALTSIAIPNSVTSIGTEAFRDCSSLTSIVIPDSVTSIGDRAFNGCDDLTSVTFEGTIAQWNSTIKGDRWNDNVPATHVHCTDGDVAL